FFFSSRRRHTRSTRDWSSDVCSSDLRIGATSAALINKTPAQAFDMSHPPNLPNGFTTEVAPWRTDIALSKLTRVTAVVSAQHCRAPFDHLHRVTNAFFQPQ